MDKVTIVLTALVVMFAVYMGLQILEMDKDNAALYDAFCKANGCQQLVAMDITPYCYNCKGTFAIILGCGCPPINKTVMWC